MCVCCVYMLSQFRDLRTMSGLKCKLVLSYACRHLCCRVCLKWRVYVPLGASFLLLLLLSFEDVALVQFVYLVFTHMPAGVTVGDSGLCGCVPRLSSAIVSLCLVMNNIALTNKPHRPFPRLERRNRSITY